MEPWFLELRIREAIQLRLQLLDHGHRVVKPLQVRRHQPFQRGQSISRAVRSSRSLRQNLIGREASTKRAC